MIEVGKQWPGGVQPNGRHVLITGGGAGLGRVLCERFLAEGANVYVCDIDARALHALQEQVASDRLRTAACDLAKPAEVEAWLQSVQRWSPHVDVLINNVGLAGSRAPLERIADLEWLQVMEANLLTAVRCARAVLPAMKARRRGVIVNISTASVHTLPAQRSPYVVTKAALEALTLALAREVGEFGIRCNVVRPGLMNNERGRRVIERVAAQTGRSTQEVLEQELQFVAMKSMVEMEEVAAAVLYLASHEARHVTGQILSVDGGIAWES